MPFEFTFSPAEAQLVLGFIASVVIPFVVSFLVRPDTSKGVKLAVALGASVVGGALSQYAAGELSGGSVVVAALGIFAASQAHFASWFSGLGIDLKLEAVGAGE